MQEQANQIRVVNLMRLTNSWAKNIVWRNSVPTFPSGSSPKFAQLGLAHWSFELFGLPYSYILVCSSGLVDTHISKFQSFCLGQESSLVYPHSGPGSGPVLSDPWHLKFLE